MGIRKNLKMKTTYHTISAILAAIVWHKCPYDSKIEVTAQRAVDVAFAIQREVERRLDRDE